MKISLDSNCFRNLDFIDFLTENSDKIEVHLSIIVFIETLIWYKFKGLQTKDFMLELKDLEAKVDLLNEEIGEKVSDIVIQKNQTFPFKQHARDYFIGVIADYNRTILITYNKRHFDWLQEKALIPEEFIISFLKIE